MTYANSLFTAYYMISGSYC